MSKADALIDAYMEVDEHSPPGAFDATWGALLDHFDGNVEAAVEAVHRRVRGGGRALATGEWTQKETP